MATNIGTAAAFTTANMKPAAGEQIDALWGANISDNTGHLYYRKFFGPCAAVSMGADDASGTQYFEKMPGMTQFFGSFSGTVAGFSRLFVTLRANGTSLMSTDWDFRGGPGGTLAKRSFGTSISNLTDGNMYEFTWSVQADPGGGYPSLSYTTWQRS